MAHFLRLLPFFLMLSTFLSAQTTDNCEQRNVIVNALDARGMPITNLGVDNFRGRYRGRPVKILSSGRREDPNGRIFVLFDTSASMAGAVDSSKWKIARVAALDFVSSAPPQARISFMTFAAAVGQRFDADGGRQPIQDWLNSAGAALPKSGGKTVLYAVIMEALGKLRPSHPGDAIYVITDGGENASEIVRSRVEHELLSAGVRLFGFLLDDAESPEERDRERDFFDLTRRSGGYLAGLSIESVGGGYSLRRGTAGLDTLWTGQRHKRDEETASRVLSSTHVIEAAISGFYVLSVGVPNASIAGGDWKLEVVDAKGHKQKDINLSYPRRLPGCAVEAVRR